MPGYEVSFKIDKTIYIEDAPNDEAALQKAAEHLMEKLNQGVIEQAIVQVEEIKPEA